MYTGQRIDCPVDSIQLGVEDGTPFCGESTLYREVLCITQPKPHVTDFRLRVFLDGSQRGEPAGHGVDELFEEIEVDKDDNETKVVVIYGDYTSYGQIQKYIEDNGYELISGGFERIPTTELKDVTPEQRATLEKLTGLLEDDEDVTNVYTTMKPAE